MNTLNHHLLTWLRGIVAPLAVVLLATGCLLGPPEDQQGEADESAETAADHESVEAPMMGANEEERDLDELDESATDFDTTVDIDGGKSISHGTPDPFTIEIPLEVGPNNGPPIWEEDDDQE